MPPVRPTGAAAESSPTWSMEVVYEDEHVRMEWSVRTPATDSVAVTFDPILVGPDQPAYAAAFLHRAGVDTLCVRKKSEHFYQLLSRDRFDTVARPVLDRYRRRLAYGSSLGAYAVLYFCAHGFETVISSSPRVSAHPRFGRPPWQRRVPFMHDYFAPDRPATSGAVVFYDPHDEMDRRFVDEGLRPAWPHARFVAVPYAGHPANQFLSEIGYIGPFVHAVVSDTEPPPLDRRRDKARSFTYRHMLAAACLRHGKPRWAERLCRMALEMKPDLVAVKLTLGQSLLALGRLDEAEAPLLEFQQKYPQDGDVAHALRTLARERARRNLAGALQRPAEPSRRLWSWVRRSLDAWQGSLGMTALWFTSRLRVTVSRGDIEWCYRHLLGRTPESLGAIVAHRRVRGFEQLLRAILRSPEYAEKVTMAPVGPTLERRVQVARIVRGVLPRGGRMVEFGPLGIFSPTTCERLEGPQGTTDADRSASLPDRALERLGTPPLDLGVGTAAVDPEDARSGHLLHALRRLLRPGGHLLLTTTGDHTYAALRRWLHANGFEVVDCQAVDGDVQLLLARKPPAGAPTRAASAADGASGR